MIKLNGKEIYPTIFPDKTSQVWKIDDSYFRNNDNVIRWEFEHEGEFMQVAQLKMLIERKFSAAAHTILELPYLPYARQDKEVTNESTFALFPFARLLNSLYFDEVHVFDPHNVQVTQDLIAGVQVTMPNILKICQWAKNAKPVYPDAGAVTRYGASTKNLRCEKVRDPLTGTILGVKVMGKVKHESYIIIDDICDGGRTFIEVAKKLYEGGAKEVHLYTSHGIFSKGLEPLRGAGIQRIFTRKGEVQ